MKMNEMIKVLAANTRMPKSISDAFVYSSQPGSYEDIETVAYKNVKLIREQTSTFTVNYIICDGKEEYKFYHDFIVAYTFFIFNVAACL